MGTTTVSIEEVRALEGKEEREESILALLGIIGTFLNLFVIVFVYIYTTLWEGSTRVRSRWRWEAGSNRDMTAGLTSQREEHGRWHWAARDGENDAYSWPLTPGGYISMRWTSTQVSGHTENNSCIRQIRTFARRGHGPRDLSFTWLWKLHWALPSFDYKDTGMPKDPNGQTQECNRATEQLPPNLSTNRKNSAIKWKHWNYKIFFY